MNKFSNIFFSISSPGTLKKKIDISSLTAADDGLLNGGKGDEM